VDRGHNVIVIGPSASSLGMLDKPARRKNSRESPFPSHHPSPTVRLQPCALAYNLGNFLRRPALSESAKHWSLTPLREKVIRTGARVVREAQYVTLPLAGVAVPQDLVAAILDRIRRSGVPPPLPQRG